MYLILALRIKYYLNPTSDLTGQKYNVQCSYILHSLKYLNIYNRIFLLI